MKPPQLTKEQSSEIKKLFLEGKSVTELATLFNRHETTIRHHCRKALPGQAMPKAGKKKKPKTYRDYLTAAAKRKKEGKEKYGYYK